MAWSALLTGLATLGGAAAVSAGWRLFERATAGSDPNDASNYEGQLAGSMKAIQSYGAKPYFTDANGGTRQYEGLERVVASKAIENISAGMRQDIAETFEDDPERIQGFLRRWVGGEVAKFRTDPSTLDYGNVASQPFRESGFMSTALGLLGVLPRLADLGSSHASGRSETVGGYVRKNIFNPALGPLAETPGVRHSLTVMQYGMDVGKELFLDPATLVGGAGVIAEKAGLAAARGALEPAGIAAAAQRANTTIISGLLSRKPVVKWAERAAGITDSTLIRDLARFGGGEISDDLAVQIANEDTALGVLQRMVEGFGRDVTRVPVDGLSTTIRHKASLRRNGALMGWARRTWAGSVNIMDANQVDHLLRFGREVSKDEDFARSALDEALKKMSERGTLRAPEAGMRLGDVRTLETYIRDIFSKRIADEGLDQQAFDDAWDEVMGRPFGQRQTLFADGLDPHGMGPANRPQLLSHGAYKMRIPTYWEMQRILVSARGGAVSTRLMRAANTLDLITGKLLSPLWLANAKQPIKQSMDDALRAKGDPGIGLSYIRTLIDGRVEHLGRDPGFHRLFAPSGMTDEGRAAYVESVMAKEALPGMPAEATASRYFPAFGMSGPVSEETVKVGRGFKFDPDEWVYHAPGEASYPFVLANRVNEHLLRDPMTATIISNLDETDTQLIRRVVAMFDEPGVRVGHEILGTFDAWVKTVKNSKGGVLLNEKRFPGYARYVQEALGGDTVASGFADELIDAVLPRVTGAGREKLLKIGERILDAEPNVHSLRFAKRFARAATAHLPASEQKAAIEFIRGEAKRLLGRGLSEMDPELVARASWGRMLVDQARDLPGELTELAAMGAVSPRIIEDLLAKGVIFPEAVPGQRLLKNTGATDYVHALEASAHRMMGTTGKVVDKVARNPAWKQTVRRQIAQDRAMVKQMGLKVSDEEIKANAVRRASKLFFETLDNKGNRIIGDEWLSHLVPYADAASRFARAWGRIAVENPKMLAKARALHRWGETYGFIADDRDGKPSIYIPISGEEHDEYGNQIKGLRAGLPSGGLTGLVSPSGAPFGIDYIPGMHPVLLIGLDQATRAVPSLQELRDTIFKYGAPMTEGESVATGILKQVTNGWITNLVGAITGRDSDLMRGGAINDEFARLVMSGQPANTETWDKAISAAKRNLLLRAVIGFASPYNATPVPFGIELKQRFYELRAEHGVIEGTDMFLEEQGDEAFFYTIGESDTKFKGFALSRSATQFYLGHKDLFEKYPNAAAYLTAEDSTDDLAAKLDAFGEQVAQGLRIKVSSKEWLANAMYRVGNHHYFSMLDQLEAEQGQPVTPEQRRFIFAAVAERFPGWEQARVEAPDSGKRRAASISEMARMLAENPNLLDRPGAVAIASLLKDYESALTRAREAGYETLESAAVAPLRSWLKERYEMLDEQFGDEALRTFWDYNFLHMYRDDAEATPMSEAA